MKMQHIRATPVALFVLLIAGCSSPFTKEQKEAVLPVAFDVLQANISEYEGKAVMFGGQIIATTNKEKETEIEILQKPLDSRGLPKNTDESWGRFLFIAPRYLDPAVYSPGRKITVIGTVRGSERRALGEINYNYPLIDELSHHLWKPGEMTPNVNVGVGIGVGYPF